jgi:hypothetical protein
MVDSQQDYTIDDYRNLAKNSNTGLKHEARAVVESYNRLNYLFKNVDGKPVIKYAMETQIKAQAALVEARQYQTTMMDKAIVATSAVKSAGDETKAVAAQARAARDVAMDEETIKTAASAYDMYDAAAAAEDAALKAARAVMAELDAAVEGVTRWTKIEAAATAVLAAAEVFAAVAEAEAMLQPTTRHLTHAQRRLQRSYFRKPQQQRDYTNFNSPRGGTNTKKYRRRNKRKTKHYKNKAKRYTKKRNMRY